MRTIRNLCVLLIVLCSHAVAQGPADSGLGLSVDPVNRWIEQLDSSSFSDRASASLQLQRLGAAAIDHLERAVSHGSAEVADRSLDILKRHFEGEDTVLKEAARETLQRIADSDQNLKSAAARQILEPSLPSDQRSRLPPGLPFQPGLPFPMMARPANGQIRIQVKVVNGDKDVTVVENGKKIRIVENANGILVEKPDGKGGTKQSKYKDIEEFKQKDVEAYRAYDRATGKGQFGIRIQAGPPAFPGIPGLQVPAPPVVPEDIRKQHEQLRRQMEQIHREQLERQRERLERIEKLRQQRSQPPLPQQKEVQSPELKDVVGV